MVKARVAARLRWKDGSDLSSDELVKAYAAYAKTKGWRTRRRRNIETDGQDLILELWAISQSHDLQRNGKNCRGYRGLRCRRPDENDPDEPFSRK